MHCGSQGILGMVLSEAIILNNGYLTEISHTFLCNIFGKWCIDFSWKSLVMETTLKAALFFDYLFLLKYWKSNSQWLWCFGYKFFFETIEAKLNLSIIIRLLFWIGIIYMSSCIQQIFVQPLLCPKYCMWVISCL